MGHDKFGHRLSNALSRAGVMSLAELRLRTDARLLRVGGFGPAALERVRGARLGRAWHVDHEAPPATTSGTSFKPRPTCR
ncbi:hypothetical protein [Streptomyces tailanensis]|uniref:hypothetical protein n=1 Tax=Streptomyces tailanensis TaxID=2569858 RepID=UPI00122E8D98|nr:hypothetical protein [Streptomyces tailanensis]